MQTARPAPPRGGRALRPRPRLARLGSLALPALCASPRRSPLTLGATCFRGFVPGACGAAPRAPWRRNERGELLSFSWPLSPGSSHLADGPGRRTTTCLPQARSRSCAPLLPDHFACSALLSPLPPPTALLPQPQDAQDEEPARRCAQEEPPAAQLVPVQEPAARDPLQRQAPQLAPHQARHLKPRRGMAAGIGDRGDAGTGTGLGQPLALLCSPAAGRSSRGLHGYDVK